MSKTAKKTLPAEVPSELRMIGQVTDLMDSGFRVPILGFKFGLDPILGLIPGVGDALTFSISALLVIGMVRKGASGMLALKMVGNILLDLLVGTIPVLGDVFDLFHKANRRNFELMQEHYQEGKHQGSGIWVLLLLSIIFIGILAGILYLTWLGFSQLINPTDPTLF